MSPNKHHHVKTHTTTTQSTQHTSSDHFNNLLEQARIAVTCDSECQHRKKAQEKNCTY